MGTMERGPKKQVKLLTKKEFSFDHYFTERVCEQQTIFSNYQIICLKHQPTKLPSYQTTMLNLYTSNILPSLTKDLQKLFDFSHPKQVVQILVEIHFYPIIVFLTTSIICCKVRPNLSKTASDSSATGLSRVLQFVIKSLISRLSCEPHRIPERKSCIN